MPTFAYKGRDAQGGLVQGVVDAPDATGAADLLVSRGVVPVDIAEESTRVSLVERLAISGGKITGEDIMFFSRQMHTLVKAGVPILQALSGLRDSATNVAFARMLTRLREGLDSGRELSIAMADTGAFSSFYISMVRVGEMTGRMDKVFLRLFEHLNFEKEMRAKIKAALRYPSFVMIAMAGAFAIINIFVIPAFSRVFNSFHTELPLMTRILIWFSNFTVHYWPVGLALIAAVIFAVRSVLASKSGRLFWDRYKLRLPIIGGTLRKAALARFSRSFSLSLSSGLPVIQAFSAVSQVVENAFIAGKLEDMRRGVERGESILRTAAATKVFTPIVLQMIAVGEESGSIDELLLEIADMYEREVDYEVDNLSARIEPLLVVFMAILVLILALGVFMPIWDLGRAMLHK